MEYSTRVIKTLETSMVHVGMCQALADGKIIQHRLGTAGEWKDFDFKENDNGFGPWSCNSAYQWRVKPETSWYRVAAFKIDGKIFTYNAGEDRSENYVENMDGFDRWISERIEFEV